MIQDGIDTLRHSGIEIACLELRRDHIVDDAPGHDPAEIRVEAVADLDPHTAFVLGDEQQQPGVPLLAPDAPLAEQPGRIGLDGLTAQRRYRRDYDRPSGFAIVIAQPLVECGFGRVGQHVRAIIDRPVGARRQLRLRQGRRGSEGRQEQPACKEQAHHRAAQFALSVPGVCTAVALFPVMPLISTSGFSRLTASASKYSSGSAP